MTIRILLLALLLEMPVLRITAAVPWHSSLCLANHGYWPLRLPISIRNDSSNAIQGKPTEITLPALAGTRVEALRVCREDGVELLFDLNDVEGKPKRAGVLTAQDKLTIPVECAPQSTAMVYVYAGNEAAWAVADFLSDTKRAAQLSSASGKSAPTPTGATGSADDSALRIVIGELERLPLKTVRIIPPQALARSNWAEVRVRNFNEPPLAATLVRINLTPALTQFTGIAKPMAVRTWSGDNRTLTTYQFGQRAEVLLSTEIPSRSEQIFPLEFRPERLLAASAALSDYEALLNSKLNLVTNGSFEHGEGTPTSWLKPTTGSSPSLTAGFSREARFGQRSSEFTVRENTNAAWVGWNSPEIPVKPGTAYLLSGWLQAIGLKSSATLHAHFHDAAGKLTKSGAMVGTQPSVSGTTEWIHSLAIIQAPPDAATIQLHLTHNTEGTLRHDGILLCPVLEGDLVSVHTATTAPSTTRVQVWEVNPLVKVFPDTPPQAPATRVTVELARNEYEPFQLAVRSGLERPRHLEVTVLPLKHHTHGTLPPVKVERVGFVPVDYPSAYYSTEVPDWCRKVPRGAGATDGWAGWWPDPLMPGIPFNLATNQTQPLWFTVRAPEDALPGEYQAQIVLRVDGTDTVTIPLSVRVLPFTLSRRTKLQAIFDFRFGPGGAFGSGANTQVERQRWLRFIADHRLGIDAIRPEPKFSYRDGKVTMEANAFDEAAHFCFDELEMSVAYTPQFFYQFGWAYPPKKFFGLEPFTPEWTAAFQQAYRLFANHLREKGWHDKFVYYISDEPHFQQPFVVEQMKKLCALIHEVDPSIPIYSSTWRHCPAWDTALDLWGIGQYGCFPVSEMEQVQKAGKQMWFTCDGQMATDTPYLATERLLPYYCFKYGVKGFEFWGLAWWTYDPWQIGWHRFIRQSDEGKRYYWIRYPDGDGFLAYPGKSVGVEGPVSTIRLEQVREGLEDYEALTLLAEKMEKTKPSGRSLAAAEAALAMARALVTIPNAGGLRSTEILPEPDRIPKIRKAVNAALVELMQ